jgi:hypothetical protein
MVLGVGLPVCAMAIWQQHIRAITKDASLKRQALMGFGLFVIGRLTKAGFWIY